MVWGSGPVPKNLERFKNPRNPSSPPHQETRRTGCSKTEVRILAIGWVGPWSEMLLIAMNGVESGGKVPRCRVLPGCGVGHMVRGK